MGVREWQTREGSVIGQQRRGLVSEMGGRKAGMEKHRDGRRMKSRNRKSN
jgi:hypothetical protein